MGTLLEIISTEITATGNYNSTPFKLKGNRQTIELKTTGMAGTAKLQQSIGGVNFIDVPESEITVASGDLVGWNNDYLVSGLFLRVAITTSSTDYTINSLKYLCDE